MKCPDRVYANPETQMCEPCQPGYWYKWDNGLPECQPCDIGKYRGPDDKYCLYCFGQNTTASVGSTSEDDCCEYLMEFSLNYNLANLANFLCIAMRNTIKAHKSLHTYQQNEHITTFGILMIS